MSQQNNHSHSHMPAKTDYNKAFAFGIALNVIYIVVEVAYGIIINSMALIADAGHNFSDVFGLVLAWGASYLMKRSAHGKYTYGFKKSSVLAAMFNALLLLVAIGAIIREAAGRLAHPAPVDGGIIMIVAGVGVIINAVTAMLFYSGRKHDLNIKGAFLHMAADAAISLGIVFVGLALIYVDWFWLDPVVSIIIALIILWGTWDLLKDSVNLALDAVPEHIDINKVENYLNQQEEFKDIHDLHIWAMSTTETALTVHAVIACICDRNALIERISHDLEHKFGIGHTTIQFEEPGDDRCTQNQDCPRVGD